MNTTHSDPNSTDLSAIRELATTAAQTAGNLLQAMFGTAEVQEKSSQNLVTQADLAAEQAITDAIVARFPHHSLLREESDTHTNYSADHLWIIDPLDGTNNYAHGIPQYAVSIAYAQRGVVQVGVVYDPPRNEWFVAVRGHGATLNGRPLRTSAATTLPQSILATGFYYDRGTIMETTLQSVGRLFRCNIRGIRRMGAAALDLSWVACGRFQGFFEYKLAPWDWAAGSLIVEEAGGICRDRDGQPLQFGSAGIIAACPGIFAAMADVVRWPSASPTAD